MKTFIMILGLLTVGCGRFDEEGSGNGTQAAAQHDQDLSLWDIAKGPLETAQYSFDLTSVLIHQAEVKGDMNDVLDYWKTTDGQKKSNFFKKNADGSKTDCNVRAFISIVHNFKNTGADRGVLIFSNFFVQGTQYDVCGLTKGEYMYGFSSESKVFLKSTLE